MANFLKSLFVKGIEIDPAGATSDQVLKYNGTKFVPGTASTVGSLDDLTDAVITSPLEYESLVYNGTNWVNQYASTTTYVRNAEATTLTTGTVVYLFGATGDHATVKRADNDSDATSSKTVGLVASPIAASENGPVVTRGYVDGIDLSVGYASGDVLWLGEDGAFTTTKPTAPEHLVFIGVVVRATNNGIVYVATQNGYELDELHDVSLPNPTAGQVLTYNGSLWTAASAGGGASITVSDTPPVSPAAGALWFESDSGLTFIYYDSQWIEIGGGSTYDPITRIVQAKGDLILGTASQTVDRLTVGSNSQRLIANSSASTGVSWASDSTNTVIDAKGDLLVGATNDVVAKLPVGTNSQMLVADSSATNGLTWANQPLTFRNLIINGGMQVDQRATTVGAYVSGYTVDRWFHENQTANGVTVATNADVPAGQGFTASLRATCTNGGSTSFLPIYFTQKIEGLNSAQLAFGTAGAKTVTLSFWVRSSVVGLHSITLLNSAANRSYAASYSIAVANTWEKKTITIVGDTSGTWLTTNGVGLEVRFNLQLPFFSVGDGNTWTANSYQGVTGTVNDLATTGNIFAITGVQLEANAVATPFEHRPYGTELALCQRYFWAMAVPSSVPGVMVSGYGNYCYMMLNTLNPIQMRIAPVAGVNPNYSLASYPPYIADFNSNLRTVTAVDMSSPLMVRWTYDSTKLTTGLSLGLNYGDANRTLWLSSEL